jgi:hypothetical protein
MSFLGWVGQAWDDVRPGLTKTAKAIEKNPMIAVSMVVGAAVSFVGGPIIGSAVAEYLGAGTIATSVATGAITGAASGAAGAAVTGGDPLKSALTGAVGGGIGGGITNAAGQALGADPALPSNVQGPVRAPTIGGSTALGTGAAAGAGGFAGGTAAGLAGGKNIGQALESGAISGTASGVSRGLTELADIQDPGSKSAVSQAGSSLLGTALNVGLNQPKDSLPSVLGATMGSSGMGGSGRSPTSQGSSLAGSALTQGGSSGYNPDAPVTGSGDSNKPKKNVWNVESLRNVGQDS